MSHLITEASNLADTYSNGVKSNCRMSFRYSAEIRLRFKKQLHKRPKMIKFASYRNMQLLPSSSYNYRHGPCVYRSGCLCRPGLQSEVQGLPRSLYGLLQTTKAALIPVNSTSFIQSESCDNPLDIVLNLHPPAAVQDQSTNTVYIEFPVGSCLFREIY